MKKKKNKDLTVKLQRNPPVNLNHTIYLITISQSLLDSLVDGYLTICLDRKAERDIQVSSKIYRYLD